MLLQIVFVTSGPETRTYYTVNCIKSFLTYSMKVFNLTEGPSQITSYFGTLSVILRELNMNE